MKLKSPWPILPYPDHFHLDAAFGWVGLRNAGEAELELAKIAPEHALSLPVMAARWQIAALRKDWEQALSVSKLCCVHTPESDFGFIHFSFALHELKRTREAWQFLRGVAKFFPQNSIIPYNLACYACQLGLAKSAWRYLKKAADLGGKDEMRKRALADPDLFPMRAEIAKW